MVNLNIETITYSRVSSKRQKNNLNEQLKVLNKSYPNAEHIQDYSDGYNYNRIGLSYIIKKIRDNKVKQIITTSKGILILYPSKFKEFKIFCRYHNCKIIIL